MQIPCAEFTLMEPCTEDEFNNMLIDIYLIDKALKEKGQEGLAEVLVNNVLISSKE